ncbi:hypothetical protein ACQBAR_02055 [Propionibacteriaceae bacterium Y1685]
MPDRQGPARLVRAVFVLMLAAISGCTVAGGPAPDGPIASTAPADPCPGANRDGGAPPARREFTAAGTTSTYQVWTGGRSDRKPAGVVVALHGDGIEERSGEGGLNACLAAIAASSGRLLVVPQTPDTDQNPTWWEDLETNRAWLVALVAEHLPEEYEIDPADVWWTGYSGGAEMLSYGLLASSPEVVSGGALMIGGGGAEEVQPEHVTAKGVQLRLRWVVGDRDDGGPGSDDGFDALSAAREGVECYQRAGYRNVDLRVLPHRDHFDVPQAQMVHEWLDG